MISCDVIFFDINIFLNIFINKKIKTKTSALGYLYFKFHRSEFNIQLINKHNHMIKIYNQFTIILLYLSKEYFVFSFFFTDRTYKYGYFSPIFMKIIIKSWHFFLNYQQAAQLLLSLTKTRTQEKHGFLTRFLLTIRNHWCITLVLRLLSLSYKYIFFIHIKVRNNFKFKLRRYSCTHTLSCMSKTSYVSSCTNYGIRYLVTGIGSSSYITTLFSTIFYQCM